MSFVSAHSSTYEKVYRAIGTLHWAYGKGDIREIRIYMDGRIEVVAKCTSSHPHSAWGRLFNGRTVKMYRHQVTVKGLS